MPIQSQASIVGGLAQGRTRNASRLGLIKPIPSPATGRGLAGRGGMYLSALQFRLKARLRTGSLPHYLEVYRGDVELA